MKNHQIKLHKGNATLMPTKLMMITNSRNYKLAK